MRKVHVLDRVNDQRFEVISGSDARAKGSGAFSHEFVVRVWLGGQCQGFLTRLGGARRYFSSRSSARKAITRERRGDYHN
jgi:hypothetical protein